MDLNSSQTQAVSSFTEPMLIVAGAGTGKTSAIVSKIVTAVESGFAGPCQILATTFTNKAAHELKLRLAKALGSCAQEMTIGTFHSISLDILQKHGHYIGIASNISVLPYEDQVQVVRNILNKHGVKDLRPSVVLEKIQKYKEEQPHVPPIDLKIIKAYTSELESGKMMDFADLLLNVIKLFQNSREALEIYRSTFKLICVDEYQDINDLQHKWMDLLVHHNNHLCCVGDPDQAIYGFRGANADYILNFTKHFQDSVIIKLECNYRSSKNILDNANKLISHNQNRVPKNLYPHSATNDEKVQVYATSSAKLEASGVAETIVSLREAHPSASIAILVRSRIQVPELEEALVTNKLSYSITGAIQFLDRAEIKDMMSYFRFLHNPNDTIAFKRMLHSPRRGLGEVTLEKILQHAKDAKVDFVDASKAVAKASTKVVQEKISLFTDLIDEARSIVDHGLANLAHQIYIKSGYIDAISEERRENVRQWIRSLADFRSLKEYIETVLWQVENETTQVDVQLMTIHAAKGLEFDYVFLPGWEEGILPHDFARSDYEVEEERRLAYVALTRAKVRAMISHASSRFVNGKLRSSCPSRFIRELADIEHATFSLLSTIPVGTDVAHPRFGLGIVEEATQDFVRVRFLDTTRLVESRILRRL